MCTANCSLPIHVTRQRQQLHLKDYHNWFTDLVSGWIDAAAQKCNTEIKRAVTALDDVREMKLLSYTTVLVRDLPKSAVYINYNC